MSHSSASSLAALSSALADAVAAAAPSLVAVEAERSVSSGFAWREDLVVTADEALAEDGEITVSAIGGASRKGTLVGRDPTTDVALLRVAGGGLVPIPLTLDVPRAGSLALAVGAGDGGTLAAFGAVAVSGQAWRSMRGGEIEARIELDLGLRRRAEGGLALDAEGHAFGMVVFGPRRRTLVIPGTTLSRVATLLERHGRIPRGFVGLALQAVRVEGGGRGLMILSIEAGGPGAAAGLRQGDVVVSWNGKPVGSVDRLARVLGPDAVGREATLAIRRGGEPLTVSLTVGERAPA